MITAFVIHLLSQYGLQLLIGLLWLFGAKKIKDAVTGIGKPTAESALSQEATVIVQDHQVAAQAAAATTQEEADAALDALADADRK